AQELPREEEDQALDADPERDLLPRRPAGEEGGALERKHVAGPRQTQLGGVRVRADETQEEEERRPEEQRGERPFEEDPQDPRDEPRAVASEARAEQDDDRRRGEAEDQDHTRVRCRGAEGREREHEQDLSDVAPALACGAFVREEERQHRYVAERDAA